jgi:hypothetical protein
MEDPQVIAKKIEVAQALANKIVGIEPSKRGARGATDEAQTADWLKVFDKAYKGISATIST